MTRREMVVEYFMPTLSREGMVETIPLLLRDHTPNLDKLPRFLMRLGPQVDWKRSALTPF
jgi:DNA mismatch repair protein MLH1